ncbi:GGDEF domain-containing protein [Treponema sp. C6A8]|uniref:GGDEF domain-containing protein n=1 Tax=Treponema sp. C6A8 TaxID=1410609 RepID=UPI00048683C1|nr:GGDEF domain-containing protein [Treponema sp. C6A8]
MGKIREGLLFRFAIIFFVFTVITLFMSGVCMYFSQMASYKSEREASIREVADYLEMVLSVDGDDFVNYQNHFKECCLTLLVPHDFDKDDIEDSRNKYEKLFAAKYPGKVLGTDISFDELSEDLKDLYTIYKHQYYLYQFEQARKRFNLAYTEYIVLGAEKPERLYDVMYVLDSMRDERHVGGKKYIELGITVEHKIDEHPHEWEAWTTGRLPYGFDIFDNEYGKDYACYLPLVIKGKTLGLIGVEVDILKVNKEIMNTSITQMLYVGLVLVIMVALLLYFIYYHYISKLSHLKDSVKLYTQGKNAEVVNDIERNATGKDEISVLAMQVSSMIMELENYMQNLLETAKELQDTQRRADAMNELAIKDALTGIRNKTAYDNETQQIDWTIAEGKAEFAIAMVDLNFLKRINDTYGHEQGNIAIKRTCYIVCHVFKHSPVFRVGGDEFVVILKNDDYKKRDELVAEFKNQIAETSGNKDLKIWERVSAAIGVAVFDSEIDTSVENVFRRADKAMYQNKKEMKAIRD